MIKICLDSKNSIKKTFLFRQLSLNTDRHRNVSILKPERNEPLLVYCRGNYSFKSDVCTQKKRVLGLGIGLGIILKPKTKTQKFENPKPKPNTQKFYTQTQNPNIFIPKPKRDKCFPTCFFSQRHIQKSR